MGNITAEVALTGSALSEGKWYFPEIYYTYTVRIPSGGDTVQFVMIDTETLTGAEKAYSPAHASACEHANMQRATLFAASLILLVQTAARSLARLTRATCEARETPVISSLSHHPIISPRGAFPLAAGGLNPQPAQNPDLYYPPGPAGGRKLKQVRVADKSVSKAVFLRREERSLFQ